MRGLHPIIDCILEYRERTKLANTYVDVLPTLVDAQTGRVHTSFNQTIAATGRLSSSTPNFQNIPIRETLGREIRKSIVAEKGNILLAADYSQLELRIVASFAQDKAMLDVFQQGGDIHTQTAAAVHGIPAGSHMTSRAGPGRPLSAEGAQKKYGLPRPPERVLTVRVPKSQPVKSTRAIGGRPGVGEFSSTRTIPPAAIKEVNPVRRAGASSR